MVGNALLLLPLLGVNALIQDISITAKSLACNYKKDVTILIDGSGSLGNTGWKAEIIAAQNLIDKMISSGTSPILTVILFSGPRTWTHAKYCAKNPMDKRCKFLTIMNFAHDLKKAKQQIAGLKWPKGAALTSTALMAAKAELTKRIGAQAVVVFTDGRPVSLRQTEKASRAVRKDAHLLWVPFTKKAPLKHIMKWASKPVRENVISVKTLKELKSSNLAARIIAKLCAKVALEKPKDEECEDDDEDEGDELENLDSLDEINSEVGKEEDDDSMEDDDDSTEDDEHSTEDDDSTEDGDDRMEEGDYELAEADDNLGASA